MNKVLYILIHIFIIPCIGFSQNYTSYFTGNQTNIVTNPEGGICLMGGASEDDNAMKWFLEKTNGGDVLVLRTSGADGYNSYLYSELGITINSVETIVFNSKEASNDPYIIEKIQKAEGIWFAGGNQWTYINYWRNTPVNEAVNQAISERNIVIGGTSAGMAIQSQYYFSAQNGTVTSSQALLNPYHENVTIDTNEFIQNRLLENTLTDTHFDNPNRKGRLITFLARVVQQRKGYAKAIACEEYTAVCIDTNGVAKVFGGYPTFDDIAYFIQSNCELPNLVPETCTDGIPLTWDLDNQAVKVYTIKGDSTGNNSFDLNTWQTGNGGFWENWSVKDGSLTQEAGNAINCSVLSINALTDNTQIRIYPNPTFDKVSIYFNQNFRSENRIYVMNHNGLKFNVPMKALNHQVELDISDLLGGIYYLVIHVADGKVYPKKIIKT